MRLLLVVLLAPLLLAAPASAVLEDKGACVALSAGGASVTLRNCMPEDVYAALHDVVCAITYPCPLA